MKNFCPGQKGRVVELLFFDISAYLEYKSKRVSHFPQLHLKTGYLFSLASEVSIIFTVLTVAITIKRLGDLDQPVNTAITVTIL